jgi:hypothetical protein
LQNGENALSRLFVFLSRMSLWYSDLPNGLIFRSYAPGNLFAQNFQISAGLLLRKITKPPESHLWAAEGMRKREKGIFFSVQSFNSKILYKFASVC